MSEIHSIWPKFLLSAPPRKKSPRLASRQANGSILSFLTHLPPLHDRPWTGIAIHRYWLVCFSILCRADQNFVFLFFSFPGTLFLIAPAA
ncbi:hypothetical protein V2G26_020164 [Clonostachys chloroleuca]